MKEKLSLLIKIFVSFGLLAILLWMMRKDFGGIVSTIATCDMRFVLISIFIFLLNAVVVSYRLQLIFHGEDISVTLMECIQLTFLGYFFNNFMPTAVGGDLVKAYYASRNSASKIKAYASVMMDRVIGLYSFLIVAAVAILIDRGRFDQPVIKVAILSSLLGGVVVFIILMSSRIAKMMERLFMKMSLGNLGAQLDSLYKIVHDYRNRLDIVFKSLLVSIVSQVMYIYTVYLFFLALHCDIELSILYLIMPVVSFVSMIPSIGGLGVREGAMVAFFTPIVGRGSAFAVSVLLLLGLFVTSIIGGFFYVHWMIFRENGKGKHIHAGTPDHKRREK
ncbi:MAG TPA: lysylphosphatidylglycerol synthase transmembrane domain-containing protein [Candidatus Omnitrophota bacterium]|nr:lysylphosphatidylglycerol synthase transmembrane domain-containing protein [Candidatus Omnitrophota bacterium]HPS19988.1 lysylphosphatidylglycerol synthase transmembrane domain-containing protein [Candidatus Omnitrophota bacterium]